MTETLPVTHKPLWLPAQSVGFIVVADNGDILSCGFGGEVKVPSEPESREMGSSLVPALACLTG
jgi:hypothetical protein